MIDDYPWLTTLVLVIIASLVGVAAAMIDAWWTSKRRK